MPLENLEMEESSVFLVVTAVQDHFMYRVYGGPASQCGYWWVLAPPSNVYPVEPPIDKEEYMSELFAICPEWNNATSVIRCSLPAGTNLVVGPGQTATCPDGTTLIPSPTILQANGNGCAVTTEGDQECAFSKTFQYSLQESPVVRTTATGSNGCKGVCVDNDEVDAGYYLATIVLSVVLAAVLMFVAVYFSTLASATSSPKEGTAVSTSEIVIDEEDVNASAVEEQQVQVEKE